MSDFGTDVGNTGISLMGKLIDALLKLISKIYDTIKERTSVDYKLKKVEYGSMKDKVNRRKFIEKIEGKTGFVNRKNLQKAGVPLVPVNVTVDDVGLKELSARCKREGIVITGIEDMRERSLMGNKQFIIECKQSDLQRFATLVDLMNDEKKIDKIQYEIRKIDGETFVLETELADLNNKGDLTQEDIARIAEIEIAIAKNKVVALELGKQVDEIRYMHSQTLNKEQGQGVVEHAVNGETQRGVTFNEAVDRWTGGAIDRDTTCYVVDAKNPNNYILCTARNDVFKGQDYIKTTYEVYKGSAQVYATNDRRFEGRPKDYWTREKASMRDAGDFGNLVLKFYSIKEVEAYRENYKAQNATELDGLNVGKEGRDYKEIIKTLEKGIDEHGAAYKDGIVVNKETEKPISLIKGMDGEQQTSIAEAAVMGKQIANYEKISNLESDIAIARTNVLTTTEGTPEHTEAQAEFARVEIDYKAALATEATLIDERKDVNAIQAEQEVQTSPSKDIEFLPKDKEKIATLEKKINEVNKTVDIAKTTVGKETLSIKDIQQDNNVNFVEAAHIMGKLEELGVVEKASGMSVEDTAKPRTVLLLEKDIDTLMDKEKSELRSELEQTKIVAVKNSQYGEKPDDRRSERVEEVKDDKRNMAEYKGEISDRRKNEGAKGVDVKDREFAATKKVIPKSKDDGR